MVPSNLYRVAAFTDKIGGGNLAGVVLEADKLTEEEMQAIAKEVGYSETAFVMNSQKADFRVRFFTPTDEIDLCGHATVATFNLLRDVGIINMGQYTQETKAGILKIKVNERDIYMEQNLPHYYERIDRQEIANCFDNDMVKNIADMPIEILSTGVKDIMLPIESLDALFQLKPNSQKIEALSRKYGVSGIQAFCLETVNEGDAHGRNFAPIFGIDEEAATGTSNGALACYLMKYANQAFSGEFTLEQGYCMKQPSKILASIKTEGNTVTEVWVGGSAVII